MSKMLNTLRNPIITGTAVERSAKTVVTMLFAAAYILLLSMSSMRENNAAFFAAYLSAGIELVVIAVLHRRIRWPLWKSIPFFQYVICCTVHTAIVLGWTRTFHAVYLYNLLQNVLLLMAAFGMCSSLRQNGERRQFEHLIHFRLPMLPFVGLDLTVSAFCMIENPGEFHFATDFLTRLSFAIACALLAIPDRVLLINVKRILRIGLMLSVTTLIGAAGFLLLSVVLAEPVSQSLLWIGSLGLAFDVVAIGAIWRHHCHTSQLERSLYRQSGGERRQCTNAEKYVYTDLLDRALEYDYEGEYAHRLWNASFYRTEITFVQRRLRDIQRERRDLCRCSGALLSNRLSTIETEAEHLLGKLRIKYKFHTGFVSCPSEKLFTEE